MDAILSSVFKDTGLWAEVIDHGLSKGISHELLEYIQDPHGRAELCMKVGSGNYIIRPPHTGYRPKDDGGERTFFANEPLDRLLLNAIYKWLMRNAGYMVHPSCKSYQEGIGVGKIVRNMSARIAVLSNSSSVVGRKFDIHKYFETVGREQIHKAFDQVEQKFGASSVVSMLRKYYDSDLYYDTRRREYVNAYQGIKQGCAVSSWLANVILYKLDQELSALGGIYVRYSDDIIYVGEDYERATELIVSNLREIGLELNARKIENIVGDKFVKFLGYYIRGGEITLSKKWTDKFRQSIDRLTIRDKHLIASVRNLYRLDNSAERDKRLMRLFVKAQRRVVRYLYWGDGLYSWATLALGVINRPADVRQLSLYCMDALRAVYTGKTDIGGLGVSRDVGITRGIGRNVSANRRKTAHIVGTVNGQEGWMDGFYSIPAMQRCLSNKWLYRTLVHDLLLPKDEKRKYTLKGDAGSAAAPDCPERIQELEDHYEKFLCSRPDGKKKDRYYAKTLSDMDTVGLLCGEQRYTARTNLEDFIDGNISYGHLKANPRHWFWQSTRHPEMVILQKWFLGEQA